MQVCIITATDIHTLYVSYMHIQSSLIALTPQKIQEFFTPIIDLAKQLKNSAKKLSVKTAQEPLITVSYYIVVVQVKINACQL